MMKKIRFYSQFSDMNPITDEGEETARDSSPAGYEAALKEWRKLLRNGDLVCGSNCPLNEIHQCRRCY